MAMAIWWIHSHNSQWMSVAVSCRLRQAIQECTLTFGIEPCCTTHAAGILRRAVSFQKTGVSYLSEKNVPETCIEWRRRTLTMVTYRKVYICNFTFIVLEEDCFWDDSIDPVCIFLHVRPSIANYFWLNSFNFKTFARTRPQFSNFGSVGSSKIEQWHVLGGKWFPLS